MLQVPKHVSSKLFTDKGQNHFVVGNRCNWSNMYILALARHDLQHGLCNFWDIHNSRPTPNVWYMKPATLQVHWWLLVGSLPIEFQPCPSHVDVSVKSQPTARCVFQVSRGIETSGNDSNMYRSDSDRFPQRNSRHQTRFHQTKPNACPSTGKVCSSVSLYHVGPSRHVGWFITTVWL